MASLVSLACSTDRSLRPVAVIGVVVVVLVFCVGDVVELSSVLCTALPSYNQSIKSLNQSVTLCNVA